MPVFSFDWIVYFSVCPFSCDWIVFIWISPFSLRLEGFLLDRFVFFWTVTFRPSLRMLGRADVPAREHGTKSTGMELDGQIDDDGSKPREDGR
jgi:hypothetical protein